MLRMMKMWSFNEGQEASAVAGGVSGGAGEANASQQAIGGQLH